MSASFADRYFAALDRTRELLADFGRHFQPVSMATSAETGALLQALVAAAAPARVLETGSGFSSAVLAGALHAEDDEQYAARVRAWLDARAIPAGTFQGYDTLHRSSVEGRFLLFLDGDLQTREATCAWLQDKLDRALVVVDDAQEGTFVQVQAVLARLRADPRGRLLDLSAWTRDGYGRAAALWIGAASGLAPEVVRELEAGPGVPLALPVRLLLCINDTPENGRWESTVRCLTSLGITGALGRHPLSIVDNGSTCPATARFLQAWCADQLARGARLRLFRLPCNRHATYAFNRLLALTSPDDYVVRVENDIEFHTPGWPQRLARFIARSGFGLACARPVDLPAKAAGIPVTEVCGTRVQVVDEVAGFCTAFAPRLRRQLGALWSTGAYIEDVLTSARTRALGYRMAFVDPAEIACYHVDHAPSAAYRAWKEQAVRAERDAMWRAMQEWGSGARAPYVPFAFDEADGFCEVQC